MPATRAGESAAKRQITVEFAGATRAAAVPACHSFRCARLPCWRTLWLVLQRLPAPHCAAWTLSLALLAALAGCKREPASHANHNASSDEATVASGGTVTVRVDGSGYHPARIRAAANSEITLSFLRTTDECCGQQVKIPSLSIQRELPLNQAVAVQVRVPANGQLGFTCGMDMYRGSVVVQ